MCQATANDERFSALTKKAVVIGEPTMAQLTDQISFGEFNQTVASARTKGLKALDPANQAAAIQRQHR